MPITKESKMTVYEYLDYYIKNYCEIKLKYNTIQNYKKIIEKHIRPEFGYVFLNTLNHTIIQSFFTKKYNEGLSKNYINNMYGFLSGALNKAIKWGFICFNPLTQVQIPKGKSQAKVSSLPTDDINTIANRIKDTIYYIPFMLALSTGMRAGEVCALEWPDINFENKAIQVSKTMIEKNGEWVLESPKTKSSVRAITMNESLISILKSQMKWQIENQLKYGHRYAESHFVCTKENGEPVTTYTLRYLSRIINKQLKIPFRFHDLRHTHATMLLELGIHPKVVQERLGHSKISTTLDTYSHVTANMQMQAADIFDQKIKSMPTK